MTPNIEQVAKAIAEEMFPHWDDKSEEIALITRHLTTHTQSLEDHLQTLQHEYSQLVLGMANKDMQIKDLEDENTKAHACIKSLTEQLFSASTNITKLEDENKRLREALEGLPNLLCDVAQLLDGWHNDGTCWTEWDESVRKRVSEAQKVFWGGGEEDKSEGIKLDTPEKPHCPQCGSDQITSPCWEGVYRQCHSCGHSWQEVKS